MRKVHERPYSFERRRCCDHWCSGKWVAARAHASAIERRRLDPERKCIQCSSGIVRRAGERVRMFSERKFCSRACYLAAKTLKPKIHCKECGVCISGSNCRATANSRCNSCFKARGRTIAKCRCGRDRSPEAEQCWECYGRNRAAKVIECAACGKVSSRGRWKYCSRKCYNSVRAPAPRSCKFCSAAFVPRSPRIRFCSKSCSAAVRKTYVRIFDVPLTLRELAQVSGYHEATVRGIGDEGGLRELMAKRRVSVRTRE